MIQILDLDRPDLLAYRSTGVITEEDIRTATDAFDALLDTHATVHLYAEIEDLHGFEARAIWLDLVYGLSHLGALRHIGRVALVTDTEWVRRLARLEGRLLPVGRMNIYEPESRGQARAWVREWPVVRRDEPSSPASPTMCSDLEEWVARGGLDAAWADAAWFDDGGHDDGLGRVPQSFERQIRAPRFGHTVHRTHVLLRAVADELGVPGSAPAYHALRAVLHALRDRLPAAEAADLSAQLPTLVRGVFYEGYQPSREAEKAGQAEFLTAVRAGLRGDAMNAEAACAAVGAVLAASVSPGEWDQVLHTLPHDVRSLLETAVFA